jgi:glycolate oxidase FAD binding subunit
MIAHDDYRLGDRAPARVERPADAAEAAALLHACASDGAAVVAFGGGTMQAFGNAPARYDVALDMRGIAAVRQYDYREMTIGADAGMTVAAFARVLAEHGQFVPLDVPNAERATLGGIMAAGWIGPRRITYGRPRDLLIGASAALVDGTIARAGGMVVKNVTGYDVGKLYVGSLGTLGVITRLNFKALPRAAASRLATAAIGDDVRDRVVAAIGSLVAEPSAALIIDGFGAEPRVAVLLEGSEATVDRSTRDLRSALGRAGVAETTLLDGDAAERAFARIIDGYTAGAAQPTITLRDAGLPSAVWERAQRALAGGAETIADLRTGDLIARFGDADTPRRLLPRAVTIAGSAALRAQVDAWGTPPSTLAQMRSMKARFDPTGVLAPGRFVGGI